MLLQDGKSVGQDKTMVLERQMKSLATTEKDGAVEQFGSF